MFILQFVLLMFGGETKLHITADDFGYCPQRNAGIINCFTSAGITDTSLLVNATYAEEAAQLGLENDLPMGKLLAYL